MKKKIVLRSFMGAAIGVLISVLTAVIISYSIGDGEFHYVSENLINECGNEINAVFWQIVIVMPYSAAWGGLSVIWEREDWGIFKQAGIYYAVSVCLTLIAAFALHWVEHNFLAFIIYTAIFTVVYFIIFAVQFMFAKATVKKFNLKVSEKSE